MHRKALLGMGALTLFLLGAYTQEAFRITPVVTALFQTGKALAADLYYNFLAGRLNQVNAASAVIALGGFLALLSFKYLFRTGRL
ncbi:MAG: hypothetical protein VR68_07395 [Peptococcaceae bacterium BRH_c4a]|nr:MAG: hypothetical protein VR68_07395 [Peptococcaceae bacterium BRH_c4a]